MIIRKIETIGAIMAAIMLALLSVPLFELLSEEWS